MGDKSGYIDLDEWFKVIELVGCSYNEDQLVALFGHYDVNCEGQLDYNSFIQRVVNGANPIPPRSEFKMFNVAKGKDRRYGAGPPLTYKIGQSVNKLVRWDVKRAFDKFDFEKAGWIEPREMPLLMVALGMHLNPSMVDTCLREMDSNCNGKIEFDEFFNWFEKEAERGTDAAMNGTRNRNTSVFALLQRRCRHQPDVVGAGASYIWLPTSQSLDCSTTLPLGLLSEATL